MKIAIYGQYYLNSTEPIIKDIFVFFKKNNVELIIESAFLEMLYKKNLIHETYQTFSSHTELDSSFDMLISIGGDGTISTVAKNLIHTDKILGIFPAGSGNGFSNETKFSKNLDELLAKIQRKNFKEIDTFTVNERFSINVAGVGFDGAVIEAFEKTSRGFKNYIKTSIQTFFKYQPISITANREY